MLQKIKDYSLFVLLALLGVAYYMLGRRGEKIKDLQYDLIQKDLDTSLSKAKDSEDLKLLIEEHFSRPENYESLINQPINLSIKNT
jgi:hypothetical protein